MTLISIIDQYEKKVDIATKNKLAQFSVLDSIPKGIPLYSHETRPEPGETRYYRVPLSFLGSNPLYNRTITIDYGSSERNISYSGGFLYKSADTLSGFVGEDGKIALTKGNHRATMLYAVTRDPNAQIVVGITAHKKGISAYEAIKVEAFDHNSDCNLRKPQSVSDRFKSAYHSGDPNYIEYYNFFADYGMGIAGTNPSARFEVSSYRKILQAKNLDEKSCRRMLKSLTRVIPETTIMGNPVYAGTCFLKFFHESIKWIDDKNNVDSFTGFLDYIYNKRYEISNMRNITQSDLSSGSAKIKGPDVGIAKLVSLYNEYCACALKAKMPTKNNHAIGYNSKGFEEYMDTVSVDLKDRVRHISLPIFERPI